MAIARLAETLGVSNAPASSPSNYDTAITAPASTPNGVCVVIVQSGTSGSVDNVTSVTYGISTGAVVLTERRFQAENTEPGAVWIYWASGVTFPAGAQTIRVARTGTVAMRAAICPMTCAAGQQIAVDTDNFGTSAAATNPSWSMVTTATPAECYMGIHSGVNAMTGTQAANWTLIGTGFDDIGNFGRGWARRTMSPAGDALPGWTLASDDFVGISVAFKEAPLNAPPAAPSWYRGYPAGMRYNRATSIATNY